jgi:hypothetical protein
MPEREETALVRRETKESLSAIKQPGVRGWFKRKAISRYLAEEALKVGITYASVTSGRLGFVHGATHVAEAGPDAPMGLLPTCVERVADRAVLDAFVDAFAHELVDAVLVRFDGAAVSLSPMDLS